MTAHVTQPGGPSGVGGRSADGLLRRQVRRFSDDLDVFFDALIGSVESNSSSTVTAPRCRARGRRRCSARTPTCRRACARRWSPRTARAFSIAQGAAAIPASSTSTTRANRRNEFDTESFRFGVDWTMGDNWDMRVAVQTGETEKTDRRLRRAARRSSGARDRRRRGLLRSRRDAQRPTGCPDLVAGRASAARARSSATCSATTRRRRSSRLCRQFKAGPRPPSMAPCRSRRRSASTTRSRTACRSTSWATAGSRRRRPTTSLTPKWGIGVVEQDFAEVLVPRRADRRLGRRDRLSLATGLTYREQSFNDGAYPVEIDALGPPFNAPTLGIRGIATTWSGGSPNLHQFSTVSAIVRRLRRLGGVRRAQRADLAIVVGRAHFGTSFAYRSSDYSSVGQFDSLEDRPRFPDAPRSAACARRGRATCARRRSPSGSTTRRAAARSSTRRRNDLPSTITLTMAGNPDLRPEVADTTVVGFVYQPSWAENLRMSVDRYEVDISDSIATLGAQRGRATVRRHRRALRVCVSRRRAAYCRAC